MVFLGHVAKLSGGELALLRTLPALADRIDPVVVLAEDGPLVQRLRDAGITTNVLPMDPRLRDTRRSDTSRPALASLTALARYVVVLRREIRRLDADLVHTNTLKAALYGGVAGRLARVPVVWHVRDRIAPDYLPRPTVHLVRAASRLLPSAVIANSEATLRTLPARGSRTVLGSPVVPDSVIARPVAAAPARPLTVGLVGRLSAWKGQDVFLDAFARAFPTGPTRANLVGSAMFGEEDFEQTLHRQVTALGIGDRVEFRGFRDDIWDEFARLDVAVHCSTIPEPFGQVVLEAMSAGLPVIAAAEGGPFEIVTDGVDGLLVEPRRPELLATALRRLADDPALRQSLGEAGRKTAARYSPERTADAILTVYRLLLTPEGLP